jgi:hypothetical protein
MGTVHSRFLPRKIFLAGLDGASSALPLAVPTKHHPVNKALRRPHHGSWIACTASAAAICQLSRCSVQESNKTAAQTNGQSDTHGRSSASSLRLSGNSMRRPLTSPRDSSFLSPQAQNQHPRGSGVVPLSWDVPQALATAPAWTRRHSSSMVVDEKISGGRSKRNGHGNRARPLSPSAALSRAGADEVFAHRSTDRDGLVRLKAQAPRLPGVPSVPREHPRRKPCARFLHISR